MSCPVYHFVSKILIENLLLLIQLVCQHTNDPLFRELARHTFLQFMTSEVECLQYQSINQSVYSPSDTEHAVTAKLKRNNAIYSVDVFTLIMSLVHLARRQRIDRAVIESTATCSTKQHHK